LSAGITVVALTELPRLAGFELASYSIVPTHRFKTPDGLDIQKLKAEVMKTWATTGFERLVKVLPTTRHNDSMKPDDQYPNGDGAPQWKLTSPVQGRVVAVVTGYPSGAYVAADAARR